MSELNPCKCGSSKKPILDSDDMVPCWSVDCRSCKQSQHSSNWSREGAIVKWNEENPIITLMNKLQFKRKIKVLFRQLNERKHAVFTKKRKQIHYDLKLVEFKVFIDEAKKTDWFVMPKSGRVHRLYNTKT